MAQIQVSRDQLVEDSVFILQCLRQNQRGGRQNGLAEVRSTGAGGERVELRAVDDLGARRGLHVDDRCLPRHGDRFLDGTHAQVDVEGRREVGRQLNAVATDGAESRMSASR